MLGLRNIIPLVAVLVGLPATALGASSARQTAGTWHLLPAAPATFAQSQAGVWTGKELVLLGRKPLMNPSKDVAAAYNPATNAWTRLTPPASPDYVPGYKAVWTGKQMLAFDFFHSVAYDPAANTWRVLSKPINLGLVAWTGREAIGWGGGCCGDAEADGSAYNPTTGTYRNLPRAPLGASQGPLGAWTGRELILFISRYDVDGKPYPAAVARGAAYNPSTNIWRRLAPLPAASRRFAGGAAWDGRELIVVGAGANGRSAYAYSPTTNRWRALASLPAPRNGGLTVWTGKRLYLLGGTDLKARALRDGAAYDPDANRWTTLSAAPLRDFYGATAVWTGREAIVSNHGRTAAFAPSDA